MTCFDHERRDVFLVRTACLFRQARHISNLANSIRAGAGTYIYRGRECQAPIRRTLIPFVRVYRA